MARGHRHARVAGVSWPWAAVSVLSVGLAGGCGPEADQPPPRQARAVATYSDPSVYRVGPTQLRRLVDALDPDSSQRVILADGRVTRAEVEGAWEDYAQCLRAAGFGVTTPVWDPVTTTTRIFTYARTGAAATATGTTTATSAPTTGVRSKGEAERVDACEESHWFPASAVYAADTPPHMDPPLASAVQTCMVGRGYDVRGITDFGGIVGAVRGQARGERVEAGRDCLATALAHLYPDLPYFPRP